MTDKYAVLRAAAEAATPGPWGVDADALTVIYNDPHMPGNGATVATTPNDWGEPDAAYIAAANPQAILALLDKQAEYAGLINLWTDRTHAAERRVAALENVSEAAGLLADSVRRYFDQYEAKAVVNMQPLVERIEKARALLAAAPSEPPDYHNGHDIGPNGLCYDCVEPVAGWKSSAALPAEQPTVADLGFKPNIEWPAEAGE